MADYNAKPFSLLQVSPSGDDQESYCVRSKAG